MGCRVQRERERERERVTRGGGPRGVQEFAHKLHRLFQCNCRLSFLSHLPRLIVASSCHTGFPRAPLPLVAALLAPFAWIYGRPDLFDSYSVGVLLIQVGARSVR